MKISEYISTKLRWISFLAILCVVFGHSVDGNRLVMSIAAQWHVPWFYIVSGAMLSYSLDRHATVHVIKAKLRTLLLPYILWCGVGFVVVGVVGGKMGSVNQWLGIATPFPMGNPHLWYLHCLIVFTFTIVLLRCVFLKWGRMADVCVAVIYTIFFIGAIVSGVGTLIGTPSSPFYFLIGFIAKRYLLSDKRIDKSAVTSFVVSALVAVALRVIWLNVSLSRSIEQSLRATCVIGQIAALWFGYDVVAEFILRRSERIRSPLFLNFVFFVYCSHGFILNVVKPYCGQGRGGLFVSTVAASLVVAWLVRRFMPKVYSLLTGGR